MAVSNTMTDMQQTPSQVDQKESGMTSNSKNDKMSKASKKQEEDIDDDDMMGKTPSGILSIDLEHYKKQGSKKLPADKKK